MSFLKLRTSFTRGLRSFASLDAAKYMIPHPRKAQKGGEDAAFCGSRFLGVADGVGGWENVGIDAGQYSRELLQHVQQVLEDSDEVVIDPVTVMHQAFLRTEATGSSTCCLAFLEKDKGVLHTANLGDSGFMVYRPSTDSLIYRSDEQLHSFNFPLQLGTGSTDYPKHADRNQFQLEDGDLVLLATDGVFDNVFDKDLFNILRRDVEPMQMAELVAGIAYKHSLDPRYSSPFCQKEEEHFGRAQLGGKQDDITVVVARFQI